MQSPHPRTRKLQAQHPSHPSRPCPPPQPSCRRAPARPSPPSPVAPPQPRGWQGAGWQGAGEGAAGTRVPVRRASAWPPWHWQRWGRTGGVAVGAGGRGRERAVRGRARRAGEAPRVPLPGAVRLAAPLRQTGAGALRSRARDATWALEMGGEAPVSRRPLVAKQCKRRRGRRPVARVWPHPSLRAWPAWRRWRR